MVLVLWKPRHIPMVVFLGTWEGSGGISSGDDDSGDPPRPFLNNLVAKMSLRA